VADLAASGTTNGGKPLVCRLACVRWLIGCTRTNATCCSSRLGVCSDAPTSRLRPIASKLTFLRRRSLTDLAEAVERADRTDLPGLVIEAGAALGSSATLTDKVKRAERRLAVHDAFGMIPAPTERDDQDVHQRYAKIASGRAEGIWR
jgi:hypothetical protein